MQPPPNNQSAFSASNDDMTIFWEPLNLDNLAYDPATATVVVRLCWAKADISDRPWRKFKNPADEDRQCKNKVAADKNREFSTNNYTFTVSGNQPEGQYWARVLVIQNSSYVATGGSADAGSSPPTTDCNLMETNTNGEFVCETFQVRSYVLARDSCIYAVRVWLVPWWWMRKRSLTRPATPMDSAFPL